jgi:hypothetical protein
MTEFAQKDLGEARTGFGEDLQRLSCSSLDERFIDSLLPW